jgi:hypothetical protein
LTETLLYSLIDGTFPLRIHRQGPGYSPNEHAAELASGEFNTQVVGVSNFSSAVAVAKRLVADGVQLIELCGGFSEDEARDLRVHVAGAIPIGVVTYSPEQVEELDRLFS